MFGKLCKRIISGITALAMCSAVSAYPVKAYTDGYVIVYGDYVYYWGTDYPIENEIIIEEAPVIEEEYISTEKTKKSDAELDLSVSERTDKEINLKWNKIDGNRPVWQIMIKGEGQCASWAFCLDAMLKYAGFNTRVVRGTRPSGQHFWCQLKLNGKWYDLDAQLGDFLIEYTSCSSHDYVVKEAF